ncbi:acyltransferase [Pedobacter frigidisoli]|uniref:Acyltransferase n=1 Tax=Pedobacter frigidisoli TaxID=2530455 RepID=A0A4R0NMS7_9SPHI|nr:acyltransferase [Pedobacter frigidisoli]TCD01996.1 acyltransferase [Pedobacter frigidisoli]
MKHRFLVLDMFRGIFASLVVFYHMSAFSDTPILNNDFIRNSDMFVDFFFVLSGFVICYSYQQIDSTANLKLFLKKRLMRLYPLHLIMLLAFLGIEGIKLVLQNHVQINNSLDNSIITFFSSLFLINSIKLPGVHDIGWNMVSWSISAELISYVVFSITCFYLSLKNKNLLKPITYVVIALVAFLLLYVFTNNIKLDYTYDFGFLRGMIGFFLGAFCFYCFSASYTKLSVLKSTYFTIAEVIMVGIIIMAIINGRQFKEFGAIYEAIFFLSIMVFSFEKGLLSQWLTGVKPLKNLGKFSYSIYMVHTLFISLFNVIFIRLLKLPTTAYSFLFIINFIVIYIVASWTYKHIEMRFQLKSANRKVD